MHRLGRRAAMRKGLCREVDGGGTGGACTVRREVVAMDSENISAVRADRCADDELYAHFLSLGCDSKIDDVVLRISEKFRLKIVRR